MSTRFVLAAAAGSLAMVSASLAQFVPGASPGQSQRPSAADVTGINVMADVNAIQPGETFHIVVEFAPREKWHLYWKNPGAGAAPPHVAVDAPDGFIVGETHWPRPTVKPTEIGDMYVYEDRFALFVPITAPAELGSADQSTPAFALDIRWAVCDDDVCLLGAAKRELRIGDGSAGETARAAIDEHRRRLPQLVQDDDSAPAHHAASATYDGTTLKISGPAHGFDDAVFLPHSAAGVNYGEPRIVVQDDRFAVEVDVTVSSGAARRARTVGGLVMLGDGRDDPSCEAVVVME